MKIYIATGTGQGFSEIAALDAALAEAGALNFNLIPMTSIIPVGSEVVDGVLVAAYGSRVYVVMSKCITSLQGSYAIAGLSWAQWHDGRGIFAEANGHRFDDVVVSLNETLQQMLELRDGYRIPSPFLLGPVDNRDWRTSSIQLEGSHTHACAVVVAYYEAHGWVVYRDTRVREVV